MDETNDGIITEEGGGLVKDAIQIEDCDLYE